MTDIRLYNTRTRTKEPFAPIDPQNVRMYVCGPTVYDRAHLGNARPVIVFDVLYRLLRHVYGPDHVTYVRNFTDVDDKINAEAQRRKGLGDPRSLEELIRERTEETIGWYHTDMDALGALRPNAEPRATDFIAQMVTMTEALIASGHAYAKAGHVLFRVRSYEGYGKLSGRSVDDMIAGARVEVAPFKEDPMDFVLWKPSTDEEPGWDSPWGRGRPGWHIECSAMSYELLGDSFDIHGGGIDLQFPHHENEIAQSKCAHPHAGFANVWMHNEMLQVEGKKMSKSLGNFFTVRDLLDGHAPLLGGRVSGDEIRAAFLLSSYADTMDFGIARRHEAQQVVVDFANYLGSQGTEKLSELRSLDRDKLDPKLAFPEVVDALAQNLDTVEAIRLLRRKSINERYGASARVDFLPRVFASQYLLGFDLRNSSVATDNAQQSDKRRGAIMQAFQTVDELERVRSLIEEARAAKDYGRADYLRAAVVAAGAQVMIEREGVSITRLPNFDPAKLESLK